MNLSAAVMLVDKSVRPIRVEYDSTNPKDSNPNKLFKTVDPTIAKDDLVIVETHTRHGFTIAKVIEVGFAVDFNSYEQWGWVAGKFDKAAFDHLREVEDKVKSRVAIANEDKMRRDLQENMGLSGVDFSDLQPSALPAASPHGAQAVAAATTTDKPPA